MRERVLAVLGAVSLIAVALLVRAYLTGDDGGGEGGASGGGRPVVACTPDLAEICEALAADDRIAPDPPTLDLADAADPPTDVDGWITWDPAPRLVDETAAGGDRTWAPAEPLGSSPLAVLLTRAALAELGADCDWTCLTEAVLDGDGDPAMGIGEPATAGGIARWHPVAVAIAADRPFVDLDVNAVRHVADSPPQGQRSVTLTSFLTGASGAHLYVGPQLLLDRAAETARAIERDLVVHVPEPETEATVVVAARSGEDSSELADELRGEALDTALADVGVAPGGTLVIDQRAGELWQLWTRGRP